MSSRIGMMTSTLIAVAILPVGVVSWVSRSPSVASARETAVEIVAPEGANDAGVSGNSGIRAPRGWGILNDRPMDFGQAVNSRGLPALFPSRNMRRITVVRYIPGWDRQSREIVRTKLLELTRREIE